MSTQHTELFDDGMWALRMGFAHAAIAEELYGIGISDLCQNDFQPEVYQERQYYSRRADNLFEKAGILFETARRVLVEGV